MSITAEPRYEPAMRPEVTREPERGPFAPRPARHVTILLSARLITEAGDWLARLRNVSQGGMLIETSLPLQPGEPVRVELREQAMTGRVVWAAHPRAGIQFDEVADLAGILAAPTIRSRNGRFFRAPRLSARCLVQLRHHGRIRDAMLLDLSQKGGGLRVAHALGVDEPVTIVIPGTEARPAVVRWTSREKAGLVFLDLLPFGELDRWLQDDATRYSAD